MNCEAAKSGRDIFASPGNKTRGLAAPFVDSKRVSTLD
jgi:hypothetical protein